MVSYVTLAGKSPWALINSYYCSLRRGLRVEGVVILVEERDAGTVGLLKRAVEEISKAYGVNPEIEVMTLGFPPEVEPLREAFGRWGNVVLDITAGRKSLVMASMVALGAVGGRVVYLSLLGEDEGEKPHMMIPLHLQRVLEVEVGGARN